MKNNIDCYYPLISRQLQGEELSFFLTYQFSTAFYSTMNILNTAPLFIVCEMAAFRNDHCK